MNIQQAIEYTRQKLEDNHLQHFRVIVTSTKRVNAACNNYMRYIKISKYFVEQNTDDTIQQVLLHEIAHALSNEGHTPTFRAYCKALGVREEFRHAYSPTKSLPAYVAYCPKCNKICKEWFRKPDDRFYLAQHVRCKEQIEIRRLPI